MSVSDDPVTREELRSFLVADFGAVPRPSWGFDGLHREGRLFAMFDDEELIAKWPASTHEHLRRSWMGWLLAAMNRPPVLVVRRETDAWAMPRLVRARRCSLGKQKAFSSLGVCRRCACTAAPGRCRGPSGSARRYPPM